MNFKKQQQKAQRIRRRIRGKISGTPECPRLVPTIGNRNIRLQIIDDTQGRTLVGIQEKGKNKEAGSRAGERLAQLATKKGIKNIRFDRAGKRYHGVTKAISEAARTHGLQH